MQVGSMCRMAGDIFSSGVGGCASWHAVVRVCPAYMYRAVLPRVDSLMLCLLRAAYALRKTPELWLSRVPPPMSVSAHDRAGLLDGPMSLANTLLAFGGSSAASVEVQVRVGCLEGIDCV